MTIRQLYQKFLRCQSVSTDSRNVLPGAMFFALKGAQFDGNRFVETALDNGACYAVTDDPERASGDRIILVDNVLITLQKLASHHRKELQLPVIAITGSNGKTTTKELVSAVLSQKYNVAATIGNLNNHIGVPLTLLSFRKETEIGVVEMGANHPGEIRFLCEIADPGYGIVTNVGKAHLEGFGNLEGVIRTKSEMYRYLEAKQNGVIFINGENSLLREAAGNQIRKITYGNSTDFDTSGCILPAFPFLKVRIGKGQAETELSTNLTGQYNFENVMCAVAVGMFFGVGQDCVKMAIENYKPSNSRSQLIRSGSNIIIMDAYNANPTSMQASILNFLRLEGKKKVFILGDMLELGDDSGREHQEIIDILTENKADTVFLVGSNFSHLRKPDNFMTFSSSDEMAAYLTKHPVTDSLVLIKGSHGIRLEKLSRVF